MPPATINTTIVNWVLSILCVLLVALGIILILRSESLYIDSVTLTTTVLQKTGYKGSAGIVPNYSVIRDSYAQALIYFTLAIGCIVVMLLLPRIQSFNIGPAGLNVTLQALQQNMTALVTQGNSLAANSAGAGGVPLQTTGSVVKPLIELKTAALNDTISSPLVMGKWGGAPTMNGRTLSATVTPSPLGSKWFQVVATVNSEPFADKPLEGNVTFHLHPSFDNADLKITVQDGTAVLDLKKVLGPFILGAVADSGTTRLELDLSTLPGFKAS